MKILVVEHSVLYEVQLCSILLVYWPSLLRFLSHKLRLLHQSIPLLQLLQCNYQFVGKTYCVTHFALNKEILSIFSHFEFSRPTSIWFFKHTNLSHFNAKFAFCSLFSWDRTNICQKVAVVQVLKR